MFDAYTVKKVLPRLLIAVVLIQLSWFLFTGLITLTNNVAYGVEGLILAPFSENGEMPGLGEAVAERLGSPAQEGLFTGVAAAGAGIAIALNLGGLLALAGTVLLSLLVGFFVLVLRQVVLIALLVIAPVALVAWILPGTEKWWKLWWESFSKLLIMYPMILGMIAAGRAFGSIAAGSGSATANGTANDGVMIAIIILGFFGPFFLIPKTFQLAGSAFSSLTGMVNDRGKGAFDRLRNVRDKRNQEHRERMGRGVLRRRENAYTKLMNQGSKGGAFRRATLGKAAKLGARGIGGYNLEAAASARNAQVAKELNDQIATGKDDEIRGLATDKKGIDDYIRKNGLEAATRAGLARMQDGKLQYRSMGGAFVDKAAVDEGHRRWGNDRFAQQAALSYEMRKATGQEDINALTDGRTPDGVGGFSSWAKGTGMEGNDSMGMWKGASFENQNKNLAWKHSSFTPDGKRKLKHGDFMKEMYEKRGSYAVSQMDADTVNAVTESYQHAQGILASGTASADEQAAAQSMIEQSRAVIDTLVQQTSGTQLGDVDGTPQMAPGGVSRSFAPGGPGSVASSVEAAARMMGIVPPAGPGGGGARPNPPTPPQPPDHRNPAGYL